MVLINKFNWVSSDVADIIIRAKRSDEIDPNLVARTVVLTATQVVGTQVIVEFSTLILVFTICDKTHSFSKEVGGNARLEVSSAGTRGVGK